MNRDDISKQLIDRGIAGEAEIGATSRLFYVYLLSALQRGENLDVPKFGTFGTRVAGVKKIRKIPYFEPAPELVERANGRFREMKSLLIGTYQELAAFGESEYKGKIPPYDPIVEGVTQQKAVDTRREVTVQEYEHLVAESQLPQQKQEEIAMPRLNLKDDAVEGEPEVQEQGKDINTPPTLREVGGGGGGMSPVLVALLVVLVLALGVFALNYFHVIHLWGKKPVTTASIPEPTSIPEPEGTIPPATEPVGTGAEPAVTLPPAATEAAPESTPPVAAAPSEKSKRSKVDLPPSGSGQFTVQVSAWVSKAKADQEATRLTAAGYPAFVEDGAVGDETWHRVRVGRYVSMKEAQEAAGKLQPVMESDLWATRVGGK